MGLNICKRIAKGLGGDLNLNTNETDCTEFELKLPVEVIPTARPKQIRYKFNRKFGRKIKPEKTFQSAFYDQNLTKVYELSDEEEDSNPE